MKRFFYPRRRLDEFETIGSELTPNQTDLFSEIPVGSAPYYESTHDNLFLSAYKCIEPKSDNVLNNQLPESKIVSFFKHKNMKQFSLSLLTIRTIVLRFFNFEKFILQRDSNSGFRKIGTSSSFLMGYGLALLFLLSSGLSKAADVDLALKQSVSVSQPSIGNSLTYTVWLVNQGTNTATDIQIQNVVPISGLNSVNATVTGGSWTYNSVSGVGSWTVNSLAGGDSLRLQVSGTVFGRGVFFNTAEIQSSPDYDIDSQPGNADLTEDDIASSCFSVPIQWYPGDEYLVEVPAPYTLGSGIVWYRNGVMINASTPEATINLDSTLTIKGIGDYTFSTTLTTCPATGCCAIMVEEGPRFDLAMVKRSSAPSVVAGNNITFYFDIYNQGNQNATQIQISDYIPAGLTLADTNWTNTSGIATLNNSIDSLAVGDTITTSITFAVSSAYVGALRNSAEISSATGPALEAVTDFDSDMDNNPANDSTSVDGTITQNGKLGGDEDDFDISDITVTAAPVFDLALTKARASAGLVYPGMGITFNLTVLNQGTIDATQISLVDYVPAGLMLNDTAWNQVGSVAQLNSPISILAGRSLTIPISFIVTPSFVGGNITNSAEISGNKGSGGEDVIDFDSTPDNIALNDNNTVDNDVTQNGKLGGDEDDSDFETFLVTAYGTVGDLVWNDINKNGLQDVGESGISNVVVTLQTSTGTFVASTLTNASGNYQFSNLLPGNYRIVVGIPSGYVGSTANVGANDALDSDIDPSTGISNTFTITSGAIYNTVDAALYLLVCPTIQTISITDNDICNGESTTLVANSSDGTPIQWYLSPTGGTLAYTTNSGQNLTLSPTVSTVYYAQLDSVPATCSNNRTAVSISVNPIPTTPVSSVNATICDTETANLNTYITNGTTTVGGVFEWHTGIASSSPLVSGPTSVGAGTYYLFERSGAGCYSAPSTTTITEVSCAKVVDISLIKTADRRIVYLGDVIQYTVNVSNAGPDSATNVVLRDILPDGLSFVSSPTFTNNNDTLTMNIPLLAPGQTITYTYNTLVSTEGSIINIIEVIAADQSDVDSSPNNGVFLNEDDDDDEVINVIIPSPVSDISLRKFVSVGNPNVGDILTYTINVQNSGPNTATNVEITDVLPAGLDYLSSTGANSFTITGDSIVATLNSLPPFTDVDITINVMVSDSGTITNMAQVTASDQPDPDSTPNAGINEDDDDAVSINATQPCNPSVPVISSTNLFICAGESTTLSAINCNGTVIWSNGQTGNSITVSPVVATTYYAQCQVGTCVSSASNNVQININSIAPPTISASSTVVCSGGSVTLSATGCTGSVLWSNGVVGNSIDVSPTLSSTSYTAVCNVGVCQSNASTAVVILLSTSPSAPSIGVTTSDICQGQSVTLTANGCTGTVNWSNGQSGASITVTPSVTTTYSATCSAGSCVSATSNLLTINVSALPTPSITASRSVTCGVDPVTLTVNGCTSSVLWSTGSTANEIVVTPSTTTTYTVTCGSGACSASAQSTITVGGLGETPTLSATNTNICSGGSTTLSASSCSGTIDWTLTTNTLSVLHTGSTFTVSPTDTTSYTAICNTGTSCAGWAIMVINVQPQPTAPIISSGATTICAGDSTVLTAFNCSGTVSWSSGGNAISFIAKPTVTTTYTATCTQNGCTSIASAPVTINVSTSNPTIIASSLNICTGGSSTLSINNCSGTVLWSTGSTLASITVSPSATTTYTVECQVGTCISSTSATVNVSVGQMPTITASETNICLGGSVELTAANCSGTLTWSTGAGTNIITVSPTDTTIYTVICEIGTCSQSAGITIFVSPAQTPNISASATSICVGQSVTLTASNCSSGVTWSTGATTNEIVVSPSVTTNYSVSCGSGTCSRSATLTITVGSVLAPPAISANQTTVCPSTNVVLTATGCTGTVIWSNSSQGTEITVSPVATTSYTAICDNGGCVSSQSNTVTVTVSGTAIQRPVVSSPLANVCPATTVSLSSAVTSSPVTSGGIFEYHTGNSTSSPLVTNPAQAIAGSYYVFEKSTSGCYSTPALITVTIDNCNINQGDADIQVNIIGNKSYVIIGDTVIYTLTVKNNGPTDASNVNFENIIPEGLSIIGGTPGMLQIGNKLVGVIPTLITNATRTYTYSAKVTGAGQVVNVINKVSADQNDPINSNNSDSFTVECTTCQQTCIATSLKADTLRQVNGSYNIKFTALLKNCGNTPLDSVELDENLANMFTSPTQFTMVQAPTVGSGSSLVGNSAYNGGSNIGLLNRNLSKLPVGRTDTVTFTINLQPNGEDGPFSTNSIAKGVGKTQFGIDQQVSDVSNDGLVVNKDLADPTVVKLYKSPAIGLALAITDTVKLFDGSYNVQFQAIVKNIGSLDLTNVLLKDTLANYFKLPATFEMAISPSTNENSNLDVNPDFNGVSDVNLTLATSTLPIGKSDTVWFTINLKPSTITEFIDRAVVLGDGTYTNGSIETVIDYSNTGIDPTAPGSEPTELILGNESTPTACIGSALATVNKTKLEDGTYNITYQAIVGNCGNVNLTNVTICDTLANTFNAPTEVKMVTKPSVGQGSTLLADTTFNGVANTCLLKAGSTLAPGKVDTVKWTINVKLNSNNGPFRNNITVNATSPTSQVVSDMSNDGINPAPEGSLPTILNFNDNVSDSLIGLAKELIGIKKVEGSLAKFDVEFRFVIKNYGIVGFNRLQLQDNIALTFGPKVGIDTVIIKDVSTGLVPNPNFTGKGDLTNMLDEPLSSLPTNTSRTVNLVVRVDLTNADTLRYENIAMAWAPFPTGSSMAEDASTDGANPDADLSGTPTDDSDPTPIDFTKFHTLSRLTPFGIAKSVDSLSSADGSYLLSYKVIVKNYSAVDMDSVQLIDDLANVFSNNTQFVLVGRPVVSDTSSLVVNPDFDGEKDKNMLIASLSSLKAGKSDTLTFKVKVANQDADEQTYLNIIDGKAWMGDSLVTDKSTVGVNPDATPDGNPGNDSEPTGITLPVAKEDTSAVNVMVQDGLSLDGNKVNDVLVIRDKDNKVVLTADDNIEIYIYNRWFHLVYHSANYISDFEAGNGWDGKTNVQGLKVKDNKYVSDGTYFYVVSSTNKRLFGGKPQTGFITVVKD